MSQPSAQNNAKSNELPASSTAIVEQAVAPPLVFDHYLTRQGVMRELVDHLGLDIDITAKKFSHDQLATLYAAVTDDDRDPTTIASEEQKYALIDDLGVLYGFETTDCQDELKKSQLIFLLVSEVGGTRPRGFCLPSDGDRVHATQPGERRMKP